jgi:hypothetical protein
MRTTHLSGEDCSSRPTRDKRKKLPSSLRILVQRIEKTPLIALIHVHIVTCESVVRPKNDSTRKATQIRLCADFCNKVPKC